MHDSRSVEPERIHATLVERLRGYFERHPRARDTAEGIARFWVSAQVTDVQLALEHLCGTGEVREVGVVGARHYEWARRPKSTQIPAIREGGADEREPKR